MLRPLLAAALAAGALLTTPANAATRCVGDASLYYLCVVTPGVGLGSEPHCVYTGGSSCQNVDVPTVTPTGNVDVYCGGPACFVLSADLCDATAIELCRP